MAGLFVGRLFSPNPHVQLLVAAGMVTMGAFLPLQGWMMALDGILIGARDFRYLAITCTLTATVYIALTAICVDAAAPMLPGDLASTVLLWAMFNIVLDGRPRPVQWPAHTQRDHGSVRPPSNDRPATALAALRNTHLDIAFASAEHHMIMASASEDGRRHAEGDSAPNQMTSEYSQISKA